MIDCILIIIIAIILIFLSWISFSFFGAPFQPSSDRELREMIELASFKKRQKTADLGSGDGKVVIEFAKRGAEAHGFEINPLLVWIAKKKIKRLGLKNAFIHKKNFWKQDFSGFDIVTSFQISYVMPGLEEKLKKELKKGAKVISNTWTFPNWKPKKQEGKVYLYERE
ncbi:MAG TPA: class I SAM-dependent methyltransferase [Patescibacteria group bacterium]|nr:class I SAM-dependent methyltransferase [Patescibacteria group bacterium]